MTFDELNELDFSNIGEWPVVVKAITVLLLCALITVGWYFFDIEDRYLQLERHKQIEKELRQQFEIKQAKTCLLYTSPSPRDSL